MSSIDVKVRASDRLRSAPVIVATLGLAALVAVPQATVAAAILCAVLAVLLVPCALIDIEQRIIPNRITGYGSVLAIGIGLALDAAGEPRRLLWAVLGGGFLLLAALAKPGGMGMGDVKLLAMMGLFLGPPAVVALLVALLGNVATALVLASRHGVAAARKTYLPFGPYLAAGGVIAALAGDPIIHAYLGLHR